MVNTKKEKVMTDTVVKKMKPGSREQVLDDIIQRLDSSYEYSDKEQHLHLLGELQIMLAKIAVDDFQLYNDSFLIRWFHGE